MKTLPVNFGDLALALQDQGGELHVYYFDTETGTVLNLSEDIDEAQLREIREEGSGRFLQVEPMAKSRLAGAPTSVCLRHVFACPCVYIVDAASSCERFRD